MFRGFDSKHDQNQGSTVRELIDDPFQVYRIRNVFEDKEYARKLYKEVQKLKFRHSKNDMFSLRQTLDFAYLKDQPKFPKLSEFVQYLFSLKNALSKEIGVDLEPTISVSSSKYCKGDFLLCHDDNSERRYVAFIYYLNPEWKREWGGTLDLFAHDDHGQPSRIVCNILPQFNSMIYFQVGKYTHHQVAEVVSDVVPRLTINGWFYAKKALKIKSIPYDDSDTFLRTHNSGALVYLHHYISNDFLTETSMSLICDAWEANDVVMLQDFLKPQIFERISAELRSTVIRWNERGPANRRKYGVAEESSLPSMIGAFLNIVKSNFMCSYLEAITGQNLQRVENGIKEQSCLVHAEIQSWKSTCYSLLFDNEVPSSDLQVSNETLEMWIFFNVEKDTSDDATSDVTQSGNVYYCFEPSKCIPTPDKEIEPANNSVCWVRKREDQIIFVSYISAKSTVKYHALRVRYKI